MSDCKHEYPLRGQSKFYTCRKCQEQLSPDELVQDLSVLVGVLRVRLSEAQKELEASRQECEALKKLAVFSANELDRQDYSRFVISRCGMGDIDDLIEYANNQEK